MYEIKYKKRSFLVHHISQTCQNHCQETLTVPMRTTDDRPRMAEEPVANPERKNQKAQRHLASPYKQQNANLSSPCSEGALGRHPPAWTLPRPALPSSPRAHQGWLQGLRSPRTAPKLPVLTPFLNHKKSDKSPTAQHNHIRPPARSPIPFVSPRLTPAPPQ